MVIHVTWYHGAMAIADSHALFANQHSSVHTCTASSICKLVAYSASRLRQLGVRLDLVSTLFRISRFETVRDWTPRDEIF
jgi:hypothetical protein